MTAVSFSEPERAVLLAVKGVGPTVVLRLEQMGISTLAALAKRSADEICAAQAAALGASCWKNSPQARAAIAAAITAAQARAITPPRPRSKLQVPHK